MRSSFAVFALAVFAAPPVAAKPAPPPPPAPAADNPYSATTWIKKLSDPREGERAVTQLEQLGDPSAIPALGDAWAAQGRPPRILQVIITLATPLTPAQAKAAFLTDYANTGRPASWDKALPILRRAVTEADDTNPRAVDSAVKAAEALGEAKLGLDALVTLASRPPAKKLIAAETGAIRAIGAFDGDRMTASAALVKILGRDMPKRPRTAKDPTAARALEEASTLHLGVAGAAVNALAQLGAPSAATALVLAMYRMPELFMQVRRALVSIGPAAEAELRRAIRGDSDEVNRLFKDKLLDRYCGDRGDGTCLPVSAKEFYPAVVLGDFHDPAVVPDLLAVLKHNAAPVYYDDDQPGPNTQYTAVFNALAKIGAPEAAATVRALWTGHADVSTRVLAIAVEPFVARDDSGAAALGQIAADNTAGDVLRTEAATAFARVARRAEDIAILQGLAHKYLDAAAAKTTEAATADKAAARQLRSAATAYTGYARMFEANIARIEIAVRCKADLACYATSLALTADRSAANNAAYIHDLQAWSADDKRELVDAAIDRAMLELGKQGAKASGFTGALLDAAASDDRSVRAAVLLALPKIAPLPCASCATKLDAAIHTGDGKASLADLALETALLRSYFTWAGTRSN